MHQVRLDVQPGVAYRDATIWASWGRITRRPSRIPKCDAARGRIILSSDSRSKCVHCLIQTSVFPVANPQTRKGLRTQHELMLL